MVAISPSQIFQGLLASLLLQHQKLAVQRDNLEFQESQNQINGKSQVTEKIPVTFMSNQVAKQLSPHLLLGLLVLVEMPLTNHTFQATNTDFNTKYHLNQCCHLSLPLRHTRHGLVLNNSPQRLLCVVFYVCYLICHANQLLLLYPTLFALEIQY